jgi:hypothetical protein
LRGYPQAREGSIVDTIDGTIDSALSNYQTHLF